jgi:hypothetical protein
MWIKLLELFILKLDVVDENSNSMEETLPWETKNCCSSQLGILCLWNPKVQCMDQWNQIKETRRKLQNVEKMYRKWGQTIEFSCLSLSEYSVC